MLKLRNRPVEATLADYSALVTAALLAFALPALTPWWVTATAALFGIVVAKHLYGGLGYSGGDPEQHPGIKGLGNDIVWSKFETFQIVGF